MKTIALPAGTVLSTPKSKLFPEKHIEALEKKFNATYVLDTSIKDDRGSWTEHSYAIFFQRIPPDPSYSQYVAVRPTSAAKATTSILIASGKSVEGLTFGAIAFEDDSWIYSSHRHDWVESKGSFIDGGRDYVRSGGSPLPDIITVNVVDSALVVL